MEILPLLLVALSLVASANMQMLKNGVTCEEKKIIIDFHNDLRKMVANGTLKGQPKASNMQTLVWDDALGTVAQNWADNMQFKHNADRADDRFSVGENIYISFSTAADDTFDWKAAIKSWWEEHHEYKYKPMNGDPNTGHYTQVAWASTTHVGCGATYYEGDNGFKNKLYVCDYGPAGNYLGEHVYEKGAGCEDLCCKDQCKTMYGSEC